jgi:hypothetical protein
MTAAAFSGDYVDLRFVKSRKVAQVVVELPIEQAAAFVAAFGAPNPSTGVPVALARLAAAQEQQPAKERRKFSELPPSQQAAMRCNEPDFQRFLSVGDPVEAARKVRMACRVESRAELNSNANAASAWQQLEAGYFAWQRGGIR